MKALRLLFLSLFLLSCFSPPLSLPLFGQTIAEKKESLQKGGADVDAVTQGKLDLINAEQIEIRQQLNALYQQVRNLHDDKAPETAFAKLLEEINQLKKQKIELEQSWQKSASQRGEGEGYSLWHHPETTLEQLVEDYGSQEYVYLIPADIGSKKIGVASNLPIPRESWSEMLEWILTHNGVGVHQANPYLRILYPLDKEVFHLATITSRQDDLEIYPPNARICFVLNAEFPDVYRIFALLEQFSNEETANLQLIGSDVFIISTVEQIRELLKVYRFVKESQGDREYKLVTLSKTSGDEMAKILTTIFHETIELGTTAKATSINQSTDKTAGLKVMPLAELPQTLFLMGTPKEVMRAEEVIADLEMQLGEAQEKTIFRYTCKHTDTEELAAVLEKVYNLIIQTQLAAKEGEAAGAVTPSTKPPSEPPKTEEKPKSTPYDQGISISVKAPKVEPGQRPAKTKDDTRQNFIIDEKTGSIIMVVEPWALDRIKDLIRKLDVPKKMVRIEVMFFEKKLSKTRQSGLNLLQLGNIGKNNKGEEITTGTNVNEMGALWNNSIDASKGILDFFLSSQGHGIIPAFDLMYRFMLTQDDVQINSAPSVVTVNQTPAFIAIVNETYVNTGPVEIGDNGDVKDAFVPAQYGITIQITPTVHTSDDHEGFAKFDDYITLESEIEFDTTTPDPINSRPDSTRRKVQNEVRIADGQTVIIGGLRQKDTTDGDQTIPFLGEIPGFGKLFSSSRTDDATTELFIMITPTIVTDPLVDFERLKCEEMRRRPGDLPEFLECLLKARENEKRGLFRQSFDLLFSEREKQPIEKSIGEYNGKA